MNETVYGKLKSGVLISFFGKYSNIFVQIITMAILARLLSPSDFGVVAVITVFTNFFSLLTEMGIGPSIIQRNDLSKEDISTIFIFTLLIGGIISIIFFFSGNSISIFYNSNVYVTITELLAITIFFSTISIVPMALLNKEQKFFLLAKISISINIIVSCITIYLAYKGLGYYSIVLKSITLSILTFITSFTTSKIKLSNEFKLVSLQKIYTFSSYQFLFNLINYFSRNLDSLLIGKFLGASVLGLYDKAYTLMLYPVQNLTHAITPILHPILAKYQNDLAFIYITYLRIVKVLALLGIPLSVFLFFSAQEIIFIFYGENWLSIVPTFKILACTIWIQIILSSSGTIFQAANRTDLLFMSGTLSAISMVSAIIVGVWQKSLELMAVYLLVAFVINFIQAYFFLIHKALHNSQKKFYLLLLKPMLIGIVMIAIFLFVDINRSNLYLAFGIKLSIGILSYVFLLYITKEYYFIKEFLKVKS